MYAFFDIKLLNGFSAYFAKSAGKQAHLIKSL